MNDKQALNYINEWLKDEYSLTEQDREALYHALDALSLLIPKQPIRIGTAVSYNVKECPHCHKVVFNYEWTNDTNNMYHSRFQNWFNGCPRCGQRFTPITWNVGECESEDKE